MNLEESKKYHLQRIDNAVKCENEDSTVLLTTDNVVLGRYADPSFVPGDMYLRPEWAMDKIIEGSMKLGTDTVGYYEYSAGMNVTKDGTHYRTPGKDLPKEIGCQVEENNFMKVEDYDFILDNGYDEYVKKYIEPMWTDEDFAEMDKMTELGEIYAEKVNRCPLPSIMDGNMGNMAIVDGSYTLSMSRGLTNFLKDMRKIPEKVKEVTKIIDDAMYEESLLMMEGNPAAKICTSLTRSDITIMSPKYFEEFVWPTIASFDDKFKDTEVVYQLHIDGNYTHISKLLAQLRPKCTLLQFDGFTDFEAIANDLVKNQLCFQGDIPPAMLALGDAKDVYERCMKLKHLYGPGLLLSAGCGFPPNTKIENLEAVKRAADNDIF